MGSPSPSSRVVRFGLFELDPGTQQLRRAGALLRIQPQPFKVLTVLVSRHGQIVNREELRQELWGNETFVDFEQGLNYCIRQIRAVLGDEAQTPRYVETIPRRGYRFIAPVEGLAESPPASPSRHVASRKTISWRRSWPVLAVVILVALIACSAYIWRLRSARPVVERDGIVIADFVNKTGDPLLDDILKEATSKHLEQSPFLNILTDDRVAGIVKLMNRPAGPLTFEVAREVCLRTNSKAVLTGSVALLGSHYLLGLRAVNCRTGDTVASAETQADNRDKVLNALESAGNQVRQQLGESLASVARYNKPLIEATTSSLEALKAYTLAAPSDQPEALTDLKRAVQLDPDFAVAYASMGTRYVNFGEIALASENLKKAYQLRSRVSERERFYIEASYYTIATGQLDQANQTYVEWIREYPKEGGAYGNLGFNYSGMGEYQKSLDVTRTALELNPDGSVWLGNLTADYVALNRLDEAKAVADRAIAHGADNSDLHQSLYFIAFLHNDDAVMQQQVSWAMGKAGLEDQTMSVESDTAAYFGHLAKAHELSERAADSARRTGASETAAFWLANDALRTAEFGQSTDARKRALAALVLNSGPGVRLACALALARSGEVERAQKLASDLDAEFPTNTLIQSFWLPTIRGAIELDRGHPARTLQLLETATPYDLAQTIQFSVGTMYPVYLRGLAYLKLGRGPEAAAEFQRILDYRTVVLNFPLGALANLQLARARALNHDNDAARKAYQDFFAVWKDADPNIPILKQAKAEFAKVQ